MIQSLDQAKAIFEEQRQRLQMERIDFYLLHTLNSASYDRMVKLGVVDYCRQLKAEGKIRFFGFSFHATVIETEHFPGIDDAKNTVLI